jgi:hypothetical protein
MVRSDGRTTGNGKIEVDTDSRQTGGSDRRFGRGCYCRRGCGCDLDLHGMYLRRDMAKITTKKIPLGPVHTPRRFSLPIPILEYDYAPLRGPLFPSVKMTV